jgi:hypothetical protein
MGAVLALVEFFINASTRIHIVGTRRIDSLIATVQFL